MSRSKKSFDEILSYKEMPEAVIFFMEYPIDTERWLVKGKIRGKVYAFDCDKKRLDVGLAAVRNSMLIAQVFGDSKIKKFQNAKFFWHQEPKVHYPVVCLTK